MLKAFQQCISSRMQVTYHVFFFCKDLCLLYVHVRLCMPTCQRALCQLPGSRSIEVNPVHKYSLNPEIGRGLSDLDEVEMDSSAKPW